MDSKLAQTWAEMLTNDALAERLALSVDPANSRYYSSADRAALVNEAARRLGELTALRKLANDRLEVIEQQEKTIRAARIALDTLT